MKTPREFWIAMASRGETKEYYTDLLYNEINIGDEAYSGYDASRFIVEKVYHVREVIGDSSENKVNCEKVWNKSLWWSSEKQKKEIEELVEKSLKGEL